MSVKIALDRSMSVPPGYKIVTGYADIHKVRLACRERMAVGDVEAAYRKQVNLGHNQAWPPPCGYWTDSDGFVIIDGRHAYIAALMLGFSQLLVAWMVQDE